MTETFAQRLKRLRRERGYSTGKLARAVEVSDSAIVALEAGRTKSPSLHTGLRLALALGVTPYFLAFGEAPPRDRS